MTTTRQLAGSGTDLPVPDVFVRAVEALRATVVRREVELEEIPPPRRVAPHAHALDGHLDLSSLRAPGTADVDDVDDAGGRFVLLHDPAAPEAWGGDLRVIALVKAVVEPELADDPLLAEVVWSWLGEGLDAQEARARRLGGTVTRVVSESFGSLSARPDAIQVELRASWSPEGHPGAHLQAWADVLCRVAGLPPLPSGVSALPRRRA
ncbi:DUF3000 domain-containing protein [Aquipuribacter sp. SD81]|uniref:DUF3000 domain-containing protein n=1 Tax=Aquipuribacter sp. SD81 TaxID=3127703 RepID=UPI003015A39B